MKTPIDPMRIVGVLALALVVGTCKGDMGGTGPTGPSGAAGPTVPAFKTIMNTGPVGTTAPGVTNLLALTLNAPAAGFVYVSASGFCNVAMRTILEQWAYVIGTSATEGWSFPQPLYEFPGGSNADQVPIAAARVLTVTGAGPTTVYLNVYNSVGTPLNSCGASMTAFFTTSQLP